MLLEMTDSSDDDDDGPPSPPPPAAAAAEAAADDDGTDFHVDDYVLLVWLGHIIFVP